LQSQPKGDRNGRGVPNKNVETLERSIVVGEEKCRELEKKGRLNQKLDIPIEPAKILRG
jgi:hypothetical protein